MCVHRQNRQWLRLNLLEDLLDFLSSLQTICFALLSEWKGPKQLKIHCQYWCCLLVSRKTSLHGCHPNQRSPAVYRKVLWPIVWSSFPAHDKKGSRNNWEFLPSQVTLSSPDQAAKSVAFTSQGTVASFVADPATMYPEVQFSVRVSAICVPVLETTCTFGCRDWVTSVEVGSGQFITEMTQKIEYESNQKNVQLLFHVNSSTLRLKEKFSWN